MGSGAPTAVPSLGNQLNDLTIEGNYTYSKTIQFVVEIDRLGDPADADKNDTFRWSIDGGVSFVQEYVQIAAGTAYPLAFGLDANFTSSTGHGLEDRWVFMAGPKTRSYKSQAVHLPVQILSVRGTT